MSLAAEITARQRQKEGCWDGVQCEVEERGPVTCSDSLSLPLPGAPELRYLAPQSACGGRGGRRRTGERRLLFQLYFPRLLKTSCVAFLICSLFVCHPPCGRSEFGYRQGGGGGTRTGGLLSDGAPGLRELGARGGPGVPAVHCTAMTGTQEPDLREQHRGPTQGEGNEKEEGEKVHVSVEGEDREQEGEEEEEEEEKEELPYPDLAPVVLLALTQTSPPRSWCLRAVCHPYPSPLSAP
ncbi:unnamed protein product [Pleuronectes platessa]|uniref:Uncharacterized protein n=1 Tax=Pleuronectes platessa TaxID=8262 RepID=A0A9N7W0J7_PLEPL|nr:unnamed protein product [Pleuronectes platessa]